MNFDWRGWVGIAGTCALGTIAYFSNPYAPFRPTPEVCPSEATCVVVVGLDGDVNIGVGTDGQPIGFDINDEVRRRLVDWLQDAPGELSVYKMPEEIAMPERGVPSFERNASAAMERARRIGDQYNARLVVIGEVNTGSVSLAFVDPHDAEAQLRLTEYELPNSGTPRTFMRDFNSALDAARTHRPQQIRASSNEQATATPLESGGGFISPGGGQNATPPSPPPAPLERRTSFPPPSSTPTIATQPVEVAASVRMRPSPAQMERAYPRSALERGVSGSATVRCYVALNGNLHTCSTSREDPVNMGFGRAAERLARQSTVATPQTIDGRPVADGPIDVEYNFQVQTEN